MRPSLLWACFLAGTDLTSGKQSAVHGCDRCCLCDSQGCLVTLSCLFGNTRQGETTCKIRFPLSQLLKDAKAGDTGVQCRRHVDSDVTNGWLVKQANLVGQHAHWDQIVFQTESWHHLRNHLPRAVARPAGRCPQVGAGSRPPSARGWVTPGPPWLTSCDQTPGQGAAFG